MSPATADASRVQGLQSSIDDLTLTDGSQLKLHLGGVLSGAPMLTRSIDASSSLSVSIFDEDLELLDAALLAEKFDVDLDGLHFRYLGARKTGKNFTLTFEDRAVALLRELKGPVKKFAHRGQPNELTRAEFIIALVEAVKPKIPTYCPQLHEKQPIKTERQAKTATTEAKANRSGGIGAVKGLKVKGKAPSAAQKELGETGLRIAESLKAPYNVMVALIAALIDENDMSGPNVLQAEQEITGAGGEGAPVGSAVEEITGFLTGKNWTIPGGAIGYAKAHPEASPGEIATAVQANEAGASVYDEWAAEARGWVDAFTGGEGATGSATVKEPYSFEVKKGETYWDAIQRLAKEVNWRAFVVAGRFFFIDEEELARGAVRLAIDRETEGIEDVDFDFNVNKAVTEATATALVDHWSPPPGSVVTLSDYGPASLGPGDAPPKKGAKVGISSAVKASTHEGKGRYLVSKIEVPLSGPDSVRRATVTLKKPTAPLPEPAASTKTSVTTGNQTGSGKGSASTTKLAEEAFHVQGTIAWKNGIVVAKWIYPALLWAEENGGNTEITSGFRPGPDPHTATGESEHQGTAYPHGAIDFGGFTDPTGKEHRESFLESLQRGYPGPMLIKATGFHDDGHCSASGH